MGYKKIYIIMFLLMPTISYSWWWSKTAPQASKNACQICPEAKKLTCYQLLSGTLPINNRPVGEQSYMVFATVAHTLMKDCKGAGGEAIERCITSSIPVYDCIQARRELLCEVASEGIYKLQDVDVLTDRLIFERSIHQDEDVKKIIDQEQKSQDILHHSYHHRLYMLSDDMINRTTEALSIMVELAIRLLG